MWTPLENAAQSGADEPPPIRVDRGRALQSRGDPARDGRGRLVQGADGAAERVEQPPAGFDDHGLRGDLRSEFRGRTRPDVQRGCRTSIVLSQGGGSKSPEELPTTSVAPNLPLHGRRIPACRRVAGPRGDLRPDGPRRKQARGPTCSRRMSRTSRMASGSFWTPWSERTTRSSTTNDGRRR